MSLNRLSAAVAVAATALATAANADRVVGWTMPTAFPTGTGNVPTGTSYLPPGPNGAGVADQGVNFLGSQLIAVKALAASTYTSPSGNGSQYSFSANNWSPNDYYQVSFSAAGFSSLSLSWDQARSSTGPSAFKVAVSVDGGTSFTDMVSYTVLQSGGGGAPATWSSTTSNAIYTNNLNLGAGADNAASVVIRFINASTVASASSGSNRIDNILINGTAVPSPGAAALVGLAGLAARRRRG